jgi:hypothetical protein
MESISANTPMLYREWIMGQEGASRAIELVGSLGIQPQGQPRDADEKARRMAYLAAFRSAVLYERGQGKDIESLTRQWGIKNLEGIEERWRDDFLWLLSGVAQMLDVRSFYFHLREECGADAERVRRVKQLLQRLRGQIFDLQEHLKYCSPLGPVLRSLRRTRSSASGVSIGVRTIRQLEASGIRSLPDLAALQIDDLVRLGVRRHLAKQIRTYVRRRLQ